MLTNGMRYISFEEMHAHFRGKTVAIVGGGPTVLRNEPGFVESHDIVVRINNYKTGRHQGFRTDVFYSYFGHAIKRTAEELRGDGVKLCICKCPDDMPIQSEWHVKNRKYNGIDFRYIYRSRKAFWFCDTYVPTTERFLEQFHLLQKHVPTTGFSAMFDILHAAPARVYLTGFDFFTSGRHNVDERWRRTNTRDPIGHRPELEAEWLAMNLEKFPFTVKADQALKNILWARRRGAARQRP